MGSSLFCFFLNQTERGIQVNKDSKRKQRQATRSLPVAAVANRGVIVYMQGPAGGMRASRCLSGQRQMSSLAQAQRVVKL